MTPHDPNPVNPVSLNQIGDTTMTIQPTAPSNGHQTEPLPSLITTPPAPSKRLPSTPPSVPKRDIVMSLMTGRPIARKHLPRLLALVEEQRRIGTQREPDTLSQMEALVMSMGMLAAEEARERGAEQLGALVDQAAAINAEMTTARQELDHLDSTPVCAKDDAVVTAAEANARMEQVSAQVTAERDNGSVKHRRVPHLMHWLVRLMVLLDFPVLLYFVMQIFNVDLTGLARGDGSAWSQSLVPLVTSVVFALLGTGAVAAGLHFFGRDLKGYKDADGHIRLPAGKSRLVPVIYVVLALTIAAGAGVVMAYRIISDSLNAGGNAGGAAILGVFFAVIVVVLNVVVFSTVFRDGSLATDEIVHLAAQLAPVEQRRIELQRRIEGLAPQLEQIRLKAERVYTDTLAKMGAPIKGADQLKMLARSYHQGCGAQAHFVPQHGSPAINLVAPHIGVDRSACDELMNRLDELTTPGSTTTSKAITPAPRSVTLVPIASNEADDLGGEW
jgi:hypothetical protein